MPCSFLQNVVEEEVYVVVEDCSPSDEDFLTLRESQKVEVLDDSNSGVWLVLTLPEAAGEQQEEGFVPRRCLRRAKASRVSGSLDGEEGRTRKFEAETGQGVPALGAEEVDAGPEATPTEATPATEGEILTSQEKPDNCVCSEETTGQNLSSSPLHPLPSPDFDALTPSQTSLTDDMTSVTADQGLETPPTGDDESSYPTEDFPSSEPLQFSPLPHTDLLATGSSGQIPSYMSSSREGSCSPLPSLPPPPPPPVPQFQGNGLSSSLHSLPSTFSPSSTPVMSAHKFLGYNPMMVRM